MYLAMSASTTLLKHLTQSRHLQLWLGTHTHTHTHNIQVTWVLLTLLFWPLVGCWPAAGLAGGFALGYATYTYTHQALHQCAPVGTLAGVPVPGLAAWGAYIRRHRTCMLCLVGNAIALVLVVL